MSSNTRTRLLAAIAAARRWLDDVEREVTGERIRDKIAASKKKGIWVGGVVPLGYQVAERRLVIDEAEAETVRFIFNSYRTGLALRMERGVLITDGSRDRLPAVAGACPNIEAFFAHAAIRSICPAR
jgi:DNA invertase Pin-like site-specific DNA recombinase